MVCYRIASTRMIDLISLLLLWCTLESCLAVHAPLVLPSGIVPYNDALLCMVNSLLDLAALANNGEVALSLDTPCSLAPIRPLVFCLFF
jgi:hypothetical protein